jgi:hypothetical protein
MAATLEVAAPNQEALIAQVDAQMEGVRRALDELDGDYRDRKDALVQQMKQLRLARKDLTRQSRTRKRERGPLDAHKQAGPRNVARMVEAAAKLGTASQAALSAASGVGTGSTTWAIRALEKDGVLVDTGERENGSRVFRYVAKKGRSRVMRPGAST